MLKSENLSKNFGEADVVQELSIELGESEIVGLLGPNGAGKTTAMQMLSGLLKPDSGEVWVEEGSVKEDVSVVFQEAEYDSKLKVKEFMRMMSVLNENRTQMDYFIETVGLDDFRETFLPNLSGGNKKKVNIASGLLKDPDFLLLDEPTSGLDPRAKKNVRTIIEEFSSEKGILVSTHSMEEAEKLCDRIVIIENGEQVISGSPDELISSIEADFVVSAEGEIPDDFEFETIGNKDNFEIRTDKPHLVVKKLVERNLIENLSNLSIQKPGLEDVFFEVTGRRYEESN
ncbi:ATP-binding cassette domain-containing protein [Nanohaloarchaea archaeon H01]|nr:ATP-binding cassette domain-containing protein [Nanohaloarchaea archaeon H01]